MNTYLFQLATDDGRRGEYLRAVAWSSLASPIIRPWTPAECAFLCAYHGAVESMDDPGAYEL